MNAIKILVIEKDDVYKNFINKNNAFELSSCKEIAEDYIKNEVDVILLDLNVINNNTEEILNKIVSWNPFVPIIVLVDNEINDLPEIGAIEFMPKFNLTPEHFSCIIEEVINKGKDIILSNNLKALAKKYRSIEKKLLKIA